AGAEMETTEELPWEVGPEEIEAVDRAAKVASVAATPAIAGPLATAAELAHPDADEIVRVSPDAFHQGMIVRHPEYGLGKVVALSGSGMKRSATVAFASSAGEKKFMLAQSALRPAKSV